MPRRKKLPAVPDYEGTPIFDDKLKVQKCEPLMTLSKTSLTLPEFKILDAYLSRINSHEPDKRYVRFEKGELEKMLGVSRILRPDLEKRIDNLFQVITIYDKHKPKNFTKIALFAKAECEQDENGLWQIDLACSVEAMEYVFNVDNIGYLSYMLKNVVDLTSRYSYILYLYLENNRFRHQWEISIDELKEMLNCTAETYSAYKRFNDLILKKCQTELNEKTSLRFSYRPTKKKGRKYTAIQFTIERIFGEILPEDNTLDGQMTFDDVRLLAEKNGQDNNGERVEIDYGGELPDLLGEASCNNEFPPEQIRVIQDLVVKYVNLTGVSRASLNDFHLTCCDYLTRKVNMMNAYDKEKQRHGDKIGNRFKYLCSMIQTDIDKEELGEQVKKTVRKKFEVIEEKSSFNIEDLANIGFYDDDN